MAAEGYLAQQVYALVEDLAQAQTALNRIKPSAWMTERIGSHYADALETQHRAALELQERLSGSEDGEAVLDELRRIRRRADGTLPETLALILGGLARDAGLSVDACDLADALLDDLEQRVTVDWGRFTVVAEGEYVSGPADIIRLRFPEAGVWSLPIVAHEFGHHVIRTLKEPGGGLFARRRPLSRWIRDEAEAHGGAAPRRLEETMADVFAVLTAGPCYAMTCLFCRFDPTVDTDWLDDHPGDAERMEAILSALEAVPTRGTAGIVERLRQEWQAARETAGKNAVVVADPEAVRARVGEIVELLLARLPDTAVYRGWVGARAAAEQLANGLEPEGALGPWDALNAGWLRRIDAPPGTIGALAEQTAALCTAARA